MRLLGQTKRTPLSAIDKLKSPCNVIPASFNYDTDYCDVFLSMWLDWLSSPMLLLPRRVSVRRVVRLVMPLLLGARLPATDH